MTVSAANRPDAGFRAHGAADPPITLPILTSEAHALIAWHRERENACIGRGAYLMAQAHKDRASEINRVFWPAESWGTAWSGGAHG